MPRDDALKRPLPAQIVASISSALSIWRLGGSAIRGMPAGPAGSSKAVSWELQRGGRADPRVDKRSEWQARVPGDTLGAMNAIQVIYGVDFSGAEKSAGRLIWICRVSVGDTPLVESCVPAAELPGSGARRTLCLSALCRFIAEHDSQAIFGLDFPFGLPRPVLKEVGWDQFVRSFGATFADCDSFRELCKQTANGRELKRRTDIETETPFSAYNLRLYRQTYFGIRDVISPLLRSASAWFAPMEKLIPDKPCVVEICPASTLKRHGLYRPYKGALPDHLTGRREILAAIEQRSSLRFRDPLIRDVMLSETGGNALDSLVAAWAIHEMRGTPRILETEESDYRDEGRVYP
jgi:hypothetical protein